MHSFYPISKPDCAYPRQTGRLDIEKIDSIKLTNFKTDSTEMILYADHFRGFLTSWDNDSAANEIYRSQDSILSTLFLNGLLTSDLLIQSYCVESKYLDYKGDTLDWTNHLEAKTVKILNIQQKPLPKEYKFKEEEKILAFEIWVTFNPYEDGWGSFPMFDLIIESDAKYSNSNIDRFLRSAEIKCLLFTGIQM